MQPKMTVKRARLVAVVATVLAVTSMQFSALGAPRPLSHFLTRQGHACLEFDSSGNFICPAAYGDLGCGFLFVPPSPNFSGWSDPKEGRSLSMDYAGLQESVLGGSLGTTISGSINERPLPDGRAEVTVQLHTKSALTWAIEGFDFANDPLLFGARPADILNGASPALGNCSLYLKFINPAPGADLPDLLELAICRPQDLQIMSFTGQASGLLSDGSPGRVQVRQTGLIAVSGIANANSRVALDAFPAEHIIIQAVR